MKNNSKNTKEKKRKSFIDLSEDNFYEDSSNTIEQKKENRTSTNNLSSKKNNFHKNENVINSDKKYNFNNEVDKEINEKYDNINQQVNSLENESSVTINSGFQIEAEEILDKGFHFYSCDRVMNKVKKMAKEKNIKLSKLITMILDKTIKEK